MRGKRRSLARLIPLTLFLTGTAYGQSTGTIVGVVTDASTGRPVAAALVVATSPNLQGEQTARTDAQGGFRIGQLPPGPYRLAVQAEGFRPADRSDVAVRIDRTLRADLAVIPEAVEMEEQLVRTGIAPVINVGTAESGLVITQEFADALPLARDFSGMTVVTPTALPDLYGVGFAGAQSIENLYLVDGMNVTDPVFGTLATNLLSNFLEQVEVKTGGFMPEYGQASGGVVAVVTKSGSNELHGSVWGNVTPYGWVQPDGRVAGNAGEAVASQRVPRQGAYDADFGLEIGGPILKDRLWFYAGFAPILQKRTDLRFLRESQPDGAGGFLYTQIPGTEETYGQTRTSYQYVGKLTYLFDENHTANVGLTGQPTSTTLAVPGVGNLAAGFYPNGSPTTRIAATDLNVFDVIGNYTGRFLDRKLVLTVTAGYHVQSQKDRPTDAQAATPTVIWNQDGAQPVGGSVTDFESVPAGACISPGSCRVTGYQTGGWPFGYIYQGQASRFLVRPAVAWLLDLGAAGTMNLKLGGDYSLSTYEVTKSYSGGALFRNFGDDFLGIGYGTVNVPGGFTTDPNQATYLSSFTTRSYSDNYSLYVQDSWTLSSVTVNLGVRWDGQTMRSSSNPEANGFGIYDMVAPRVQGIWDFTGSGRGKLAGSWGRFYYSMPLDLGDRAFGAESLVVYQQTCPIAPYSPGSFPTGTLTKPYPGGGQGPACPTAFVTQVGGATPVAPDLKGAYVDQFNVQLQYEVLSDLSVGFEYLGRRQSWIIEDMSSDGANFFIANPGYGKTFTRTLPDGSVATYNPQTLTTVDPATGRTITAQVPKPQRSYDAITVSMTKNFSTNWLAQVSYTWSQLYGNYAGPFRGETGQLNPGQTSEYDLATLMSNRTGWLPADVPHAIKVYGAYTWPVSPRFSLTGGAAFNALSGTPVNALGADLVYGPGQAFLIQRGQGGRTPFFTQLDLRVQARWAIAGSFALSAWVDFFNVFNTQTAVAADQNYTYDFVQPVVGAQCSSQNAAFSSNPVQNLQNACPDLKYLKTVDGRPVTVNQNWGRAAASVAAYQQPFSMRLGLKLAF
jgi:hypothetical protein